MPLSDELVVISDEIRRETSMPHIQSSNLPPNQATPTSDFLPPVRRSPPSPNIPLTSKLRFIAENIVIPPSTSSQDSSNLRLHHTKSLTDMRHMTHLTQESDEPSGTSGANPRSISNPPGKKKKQQKKSPTRTQQEVDIPTKQQNRSRKKSKN